MKAGYTLVICEKPDSAMRVADALSDGKASRSTAEGVTVFRFDRGGEEYVVCAAQGHLYSVSDPFAERSVYPVFDVEWHDLESVGVRGREAAARIAAIRKLAAGASSFVNACDYDAEGETIGFNVLRYACGGKEDGAGRATFSTLTKDELVESFRSIQRGQGRGLATAGRARHFVDFAWGVNLSRALSQSAAVSGRRYRTVSVGRVQGPTLAFVVERERQIRGYVPRPYWTAKCAFDKDGVRLLAPYSMEKLARKADVEAVARECEGKDGLVTTVATRSFESPPPFPFSIGDLQKEAHKLFRYSPTLTLLVAERLYLDALISYPRTGSQKLPASIDCGKIIRGLAQMKEYSLNASRLLHGPLRPVQGGRDDPAHPAIHPTGEKPRRPLRAQEAHVFDLVVKRFLSSFAPPARREGVSVAVSVGAHTFKLGGSRTVYRGWLEYYAPYGRTMDVELPRLVEGERLPVSSLTTDEKFEPRPPRYNQGTLLEKMEKEEIGTKATRAEVITTLIGRGYIGGESLAANDLGFAVVEAMEHYAPEIISTSLTRSVEKELGAIEDRGGDEKELVRETVRSISDQLLRLNQNELDVGRALDLAVQTPAKAELGACPVCRTGRLRVIRSRKSGKRFVGCTNYPSGCRASGPLPQKGKLKVAAKPCPSCSWPVVHVVAVRRPWTSCVNPNCPSKDVKKDEV
ncbi:MAG: DNA topoisomerase I [Nitrososphaerota archaeon]|nr:DNA topoisomerase I [Nitrososphaerota archaeon]